MDLTKFVNHVWIKYRLAKNQAAYSYVKIICKHEDNSYDVILRKLSKLTRRYDWNLEGFTRDNVAYIVLYGVPETAHIMASQCAQSLNHDNITYKSISLHTSIHEAPYNISKSIETL